VKLLALFVGALVALAGVHTAASGADYTAAAANPGTSFTTAADFNTVAVSLTDPGTNLRGTVTLSATAASDRGIAGVTFQTSPAGAGTWTTACTASTAPYSCSYDTTATADGLRDIRAVATDTAGYTRTASVTGRRVDNTAPATTLTDPGSPLTGTKSLTATASDAGSGPASTVLQYRLIGGSTWTTICSALSCSLNTATLADGSYDVRSLATDAAGNTSTSTVSARIVDNTVPTATLSLPATVRGTFTLAATTGDGNGSGVASVLYQMRPTGTSTWSTACSSSSAPFSCTGDTSSVPDGGYDVRAIATDGAGFSTTTATVTTRLDNTAPTATLTDPGTPLSGTVTLAATATDGGSGVVSVKIESAPAGTSSWTTVCTDTTSSYSCSWSTTGVTDGLYDLHAIATDAAGNTTTSTVTNRRVDNNGPTVAVTDPGSPIRNTISVAATASDPAGVASVTIQRKLSAGSTWTTICTDSASPYSCPLTGLADGTYDFRAQATDTVGHSSTSATVASRVVDDTAPTGTGIQAVNGGTAQKIDAGDVITFSFSEPMAPASIFSGWTGTSTAVNVRVTDAGALDTLQIYDTTYTTKLNLGDVALKANRTAAGARFAATMTMSGSTVTVTVGALISGATTSSSSTTPMVWTPSTAATDLAGNAMSATAVTETGTADVDF
jgi:Bacterial Ig domain